MTEMSRETVKLIGLFANLIEENGTGRNWRIAKVGAPRWNRTINLLIKSQLLYQLS